MHDKIIQKCISYRSDKPTFQKRIVRLNAPLMACCCAFQPKANTSSFFPPFSCYFFFIYLFFLSLIISPTHPWEAAAPSNAPRSSDTDRHWLGGHWGRWGGEPFLLAFLRRHHLHHTACQGASCLGPTFAAMFSQPRLDGVSGSTPHLVSS